jgi:SAM-dependent methyltransferase
MKVRERPIKDINPELLEKQNVIDVYSQIVDQFNETRMYLWPGVKQFLDNLSVGLNIAEIGVGNGRHLEYRPELKIKGTDVVPGFISLCQSKGLDVVYGDMREIPYENESLDVLLCIATFHHLVGDENRRKGVREFERVLKKGGVLFLQVWEGDDEDVFMKWKNKRTGEDLDRYYFKFKEETLRNYLKRFKIEVMREEKKIIIIGTLG